MTESTWQAFSEHQPELMSYVRETCLGGTVDNYAYSSGAISTYLCIQNQLEITGESPFITTEDVGLHDFNITDQQFFQAAPSDAEQVGDDLEALFHDKGVDAFTNLLVKSSPEFATIIGSIITDGGFTVYENMSFLRGVYDVYMPFYNKRESEVMYDKLIWLPGLAMAFDSGYYSYGNRLDKSADDTSHELDEPR